MLAIQLSRQLGDLQLLVRNQSLIVGGFGLGHRQFGCDLFCPVVRGKQRRLQRIDIVRQVVAGSGHAKIESQIPAADLAQTANAYPARCGRNVCRGFRQSMPSSM